MGSARRLRILYVCVCVCVCVCVLGRGKGRWEENMNHTHQCGMAVGRSCSTSYPHSAGVTLGRNHDNTTQPSTIATTSLVEWRGDGTYTQLKRRLYSSVE